MANYDKDTKFYWLQLKEDFFENDAIEWLEEQEPNGRDYAYFYLKLCLKSLKTNGILIRKVGNFLIPYDNQKLAELTKMDFDTVTVAMELLKKIGLVKILENGEIYINQLESLIGSKSIGAFKKQQQRSLRGGQGVDKCPPEIEIEKEIEIEIDKEVEEEKINNINNINNNIIKLDNEIDSSSAADIKNKLQEEFICCTGSTNLNAILECISYLDDLPFEVIQIALKKAADVNGGWRYAKTILNRWVKGNINTLQKIQAEELNFRNKNRKNQPQKETEAEAIERKVKELEEAIKKDGD